MLLMMAVLALIGCRGNKDAVQVMPVSTIVERTDSLVAVAVPADSAGVEAVFVVDSAGKIALARLSEAKQHRAETRFFWDGTVFKWRSIIKRDTIYIPAKTIKTTTEKPYPVDRIVYQDKEFRWWHSALMALGAVFIGIIIFLTIKHFARL
jgi:uncharacterized protein YcfL